MSRQILTVVSFLLLLNCSFNKHVCTCTGEHHELIVEPEEDTWEDLTDYNATNFIQTLYYVKKNGYLELECNASFPIQWTFTGFFSTPDTVQMYAPKRNLKEKTYLIGIYIHFEEDQNFVASMRVKCEKVGEPNVEKSVLIFLRRNSSQTLIQPKQSEVFDSKLIPCQTCDPTLTPSLYIKIKKGTQKLVDDTSLRYVPYEGFQSDQVFNGVYSCRQGNYSIRIKASVTPSSDFEFTPKSNSVRALSDKIIQFECLSKSGLPVRLNFTGDYGENIRVNYSKNGTKVIALVSAPSSIVSSINYRNQSRVKGKGHCFVEKASGNATVKKWSFEFLKAPHFYLNTNTGATTCFSDISPSALQTVRCPNEMDCRFMLQCIDDASRCTFGAQKELFSNEVLNCFSSDGDFTEECVQTPFLHASGLAQCNVNGLEKHMQYFTSLDELKYTDWRQAREEQLVQIREVTFPNGTTRFTCTMLAYLFAGNVYFEVEYKNGTRSLLEGSIVSAKRAFTQSLDWRNVHNGETTTTRVINIRVSDDTIAVHCLAAWWNRTDVLRASKKYNIQGSGNAALQIVGGVISCLVITILVLLLVVFFLRYKRAQKLLRDLTDEEVDLFLNGKPELLDNGEINNIQTVDFLPFPKEYEIASSDLKFENGKNFLGFGNFSYVVCGVVVSKQKSVAIKISKPSANVDFFKSLLSEVKIMVYIGKHENVVCLVGVCTEDIKNRCIHIVTDICELGSLKDFIMKAKPTFVNLINEKHELDISIIAEASSSEAHLSTLQLIRFSRDIAKGMEYLAYKLVIHADLAARNVLLTSGKVVKISDFGLSKKLYEDTNYVKTSSTPLPWRWMAIESLSTRTFSTSSDVWAFGVTLFEIFSLGDTPYPNEDWDFGFVGRLENGMRMGRPKYCTNKIYSVMGNCWEKEPQQRPSFSTLRSFFEKLLGKYAVSSAQGSKAASRTDLITHDSGLDSPTVEDETYQSFEMENNTYVNEHESQYTHV